MSEKGEISWKRVAEDGTKLQVYARCHGGQWTFYERERRYDQWQEVAEPPLEDWLELLDGVQRRINRRLVRPEEEGRIRKLIKERFPEAELPQ